MRVRSILTALCSAAIVVAISANVAALAASNLNSSRSNIYRPAASDADKAACKAVSAAIVVENGKQVCVNPKPPAGWSERQLPSCETCNRLCPGVCFMHVEGGCICYYDPLRTDG